MIMKTIHHRAAEKSSSGSNIQRRVRRARREWEGTLDVPTWLLWYPGLLARELDHVVRRGVEMNSGIRPRSDRGTRDHAAHQMETIADHRTGNAVARDWHRRHRRPLVGAGIVRLEGPEGPDQLRGRDLAAGHVDPASVGSPTTPAAWSRHLRPHGPPAVHCRVILLDDIAIAGGRAEARAEAAADDVNLAAHQAPERLVPRRWHRAARFPLVGRLVGGGIVLFHDAHGLAGFVSAHDIHLAVRGDAVEFLGWFREWRRLRPARLREHGCRKYQTHQCGGRDRESPLQSR